jgi:O-antigen/teichoic acid export membrane protein
VSVAAAGTNRRRLITAAGTYTAAALGILGTLVVFRVLGPREAGQFSIVIGVVQFLSLLIDLTADEALVKYGFRYATQEDWGRFHRAFRVTFAFEATTAIAAGLLIAALSSFAGSIFQDAQGLTVPLLLAAPLPLLQSMESTSSVLLILRGRYDIRGLFLAFGMGLRLAGLAAGAQHGVTGAILGLLITQLVTTASRSPASCSRARSTPGSTPSAPGSRRSRSASSATRPPSASSGARRRRSTRLPCSRRRCA